ncbi:hypothetical protein V6N13_104293 [Hibiscus sabdariffa]|uniref:Uncharacterized protein n=1 Tax=Hibiscus sabdariffa TaxID=183260 RepID=A0ABR2DJD8_9ROSI
MRRPVEASGREVKINTGEERAKEKVSVVAEKLGLENGDDGCEMNKLVEERFSFIEEQCLSSNFVKLRNYEKIRLGIYAARKGLL